MNFSYHEKSGTHTGFCLVKSCEKKINKNGGAYLDMVLSDRSGEINAKLWNFDENIHGFFQPNTLVKVQGTINKFNDVDQFRVDRIRPVVESDGVKIEDYVSSAVYSGEVMFDELIRIADSFTDKEIALLVKTILNENKEKLLYYPAAFKLHHAMRSGLLQHTLSIVRLAQSICSIYPFVDSDLLLGGAMLHDIAKLEEIVSNETGIASGYSVEGTLLGHLVKGAMLVDKKAEELGINHEKAVLLEHMLISHHGDPEFGAAVRPLFIEADILSALDRLDARIVEINGAVNGIEQGTFSARQWALDNRSFYNHGRADVTKETDLGL
ncbi:MAG: HD domain-containing protein [Clostridia bacterium]|nr:HD domain-containing protein [Clostridia bacterium]MBR6620258.1 HD domain-containing protein [Clostridia bacterium]